MTNTPRGYTVQEINLDEMLVDYTFNSRGEVSPYQVDDLIKSLEQGPLQTPVTVEAVTVPDDPKIKWRLVSGFRRHMAFKTMGRKTIPAFIKEHISEDETRTHNIIENLARKDLNLVQQAKSLRYFFEKNWSNALIAQQFGQSEKWVKLMRTILEFPYEVQVLIAADVLSFQQIMAYKHMPQDKQFEIIKQLKDKKYNIAMFGVKTRERKAKVKLNKNYLQCIKPEDNEIERLKMCIYNSIGPGIATMLLGWVQGYSTTAQIWRDVIAWTEKEGYCIEVPEDIQIAIQHQP